MVMVSIGKDWEAFAMVENRLHTHDLRRWKRVLNRATLFVIASFDNACFATNRTSFHALSLVEGENGQND